MSIPTTRGAHAGYAVSYSADCTSTLAIGDTKTCTVTNNDIAPPLTVVKHVINKAGSTGAASDFTMHVTGNPATPATFAGAKSPGVTKTLQAGPHDVSESGAATGDYTESRSADCTGTLSVGDAKTCTITNTRKTGTLKVVKDLVPASDSGRFDLRVDGSVVKADAADQGEATVEVTAGSHTVSELAGSTGTLSNYDSDIACSNEASSDGPGPLQVTVGNDSQITCTITNVRRATVTIREVTLPDDDGATTFGFGSSLPATAGLLPIVVGGLFSLADGNSVTTHVAPGEHSVTEDNPHSLGYKLVGLTCTEDGTQNSTVSGAAVLATERHAALNAEPGETIVCTFTNRRVVSQAVVVKAGDTFSYHGDTVSYTFAVSNNGNSPLHDVHVTDDKCPNVSSAPTSKQNDNGDAVLDAVGSDATNPEVWVFTCSYTLTGAHAAGEANPIVNTATVTGVDELDRTVSDTDQHSTKLLHPAIALAKSGPATATAGARVTYLITANNTGDVAFAEQLVVVTDALCEAPPVRVDVGADTSSATFDPGDTWRYGCVVQTAPGQTLVHNVANVEGTDIHGRHVTAQATADTTLSPAARSAVLASGDVIAAPAAAAPATAKLRGPTGCMPRTAKLVVTGTHIATVRFTVDGRGAKTIKQADKKGRYVHTVLRSKLRSGTHRVKARVVFRAGSTPSARTLVMVLNRCKPAIIKPKFTG